MKTKANLLQASLWFGVLVMLCVAFPGKSDQRAALPTPDGSPAKQGEAIPWSQIAAKAGVNYQGEGLAVTATTEGARLRCIFQKLEGEATSDGLWLTSTVPDKPNDRFRVKATAVGRVTPWEPVKGVSSATTTVKLEAPLGFGVRRRSEAQSPLSEAPCSFGVFAHCPSESGDFADFVTAVQDAIALPRTGTVEVADKLVRFIRPGLVEEYSVSMDGVRQDFVVLEKPGGASVPASRLASSLAPPTEGQLRLELAVTGARVEPIAGGVHPVRYVGQAVDHERGNMLSYGARLVLEKSGRKIAYGRLRVTDATGKELTARLDVAASRQSAAEMKQEDGGGLPTRRYACLAVIVDDAQAVYPIRIDPTFSDANWAAVDSGLDGPVRALGIAGSNLYAGGSFTMAGGITANRIAQWNGSGWSALGSGFEGVNGVNPRINALAVSGSELYVGGFFRTAGGTAATNIAKWDGDTWSPLGSGINNEVFALVVSGSELCAGGNFTTAGGIAANCIAKWNGSSWSALGSGIGGINGGGVYALVVSGDDLYAGGLFKTAGGNAANYIAKWDGNSWSALGSGMNDWVLALAASGGDLYAGGYFWRADGKVVNYVAQWNGSSWSALGSGIGGFSPYVLALMAAGDDLYAGGQFTTAGGIAANYIAKWNGSNWSALGSGMGGSTPYVAALAVSGSDLYAGGRFTTTGGKACGYIARAVLGDAPGYNQLTGTLLSGDAMQFSYVGYPATNYALERAFNLSPPISWVGQETNTMTVSGVLTFTNAAVPGTNNFWRVRSVP